MGETLLSGLVRAGRDAGEIVVTERREERAQQLTRTYGVRTMSNVEAAKGATTLAIVVKPQDMSGLVAEIAPHLREVAPVVSLAAGITTGNLENLLPAGPAVVRELPNTPPPAD